MDKIIKVNNWESLQLAVNNLDNKEGLTLVSVTNIGEEIKHLEFAIVKVCDTTPYCDLQDRLIRQYLEND